MKERLSPEKVFDRDQELREYAGPDRVVASGEVAEALKLTAEASYKVETGIPSLDRILESVEAGELVVVSGPTSGGKTSLLMNITQNMANNKVPSAWFTMEVTPRQFIAKISNRGELPLFYLPFSGFEDAPEEVLASFKAKNGRSMDMFDWIELKITEARVKYDVKVIFIDHLHQLFSLSKMAQSRNISAEIGDLTAKIKQIAVDNNLIIFLIAHSKDNPDQVNKEPYMESVRDSGLIIRYADTVIGIWRVANKDEIVSTRVSVIGEDDNKAKVRVWKNRRTGKRGAFFLYHFGHLLTEDAFYGMTN